MTLVFKCFNLHRIYSPTKPIADSMLPISFNVVGIIRLAGVVRQVVKPVGERHQSEKRRKPTGWPNQSGYHC